MKNIEAIRMCSFLKPQLKIPVAEVVMLNISQKLFYFMNKNVNRFSML